MPTPGIMVSTGTLVTASGEQGIRGVQGVKGDKGDTGPEGSVEEAPQDGIVYGRWNAQWVGAVAISGDTMKGNLNLNYDYPLINLVAKGSNQTANLWFSTAGSTNPSDGDKDCLALYKMPAGADYLYINYNDSNRNTVWSGYLLDSHHKVSNAEMTAGAAVANIGYTPVNRAGDTISGRLNVGPPANEYGVCIYGDGIAGNPLWIDAKYAQTNAVNINKHCGYGPNACYNTHIFLDCPTSGGRPGISFNIPGTVIKQIVLDPQGHFHTQDGAGNLRAFITAQPNTVYNMGAGGIGFSRATGLGANSWSEAPIRVEATQYGRAGIGFWTHDWGAAFLYLSTDGKFHFITSDGLDHLITSS
jgi:hypothetical protein